MAKTGTPRSAAQGFVDHLNGVLNATASDARLSLVALPGDENVFEITRLVEGERAPLNLFGSSRQLAVHQTIEVANGHCRTESYGYRLQSDESTGSWLVRWEYFRSRPKPDYSYSLAHLHVNGTLVDGSPLKSLHIATGRVPLESVLWHLIAEWDIEPRSEDWQQRLSESVQGFHERRTAH